MCWPFKLKIIRYPYDWGYGRWTYWSTKKTSNTDTSAVAEEENVNEAVTAEAKASNDMEINFK